MYSDKEECWGEVGMLQRIKKKEKRSSPAKRLRSFSPKIKELKQRTKEPVVFSFEILDKTHDAFNLGDTDASWFIGLLDVLSVISNLSWAQVIEQKRRVYDPHKHNWKKTNFKFKFDEDTLRQNDGWQFRISKSKGRVHGFLVGNIFYIYWLDPHHNMSNSAGYGGVKNYPYLPSEYEILEQETNQIRMEYEELQKEHKEVEGWYDEEVKKCDKCVYKNAMIS